MKVLGMEYFISFESNDENILYGFVRLRLNREWHDVLPHLHDHAMIQELHVYGSHTNVGKTSPKHTTPRTRKTTETSRKDCIY